MKKYIVTLFLAVAAAAYAQPYQIAVIPKSTTHEYWQTVHAGAIKAQQELKAKGTEVTLLWEGTEREDNLQGQIDLIKSMVTRHVSGIVLAPQDVRALVPPVEAAAAVKIPTVIIDSGLQSTVQLSFVATDNYKGGRLGAIRLGQLLGGKGKVILLRFQKGAASTEAREAGFLDTIKNQYAGIQVLSSDQYAGGTAESAKAAALDLLKRYGQEVNGVFCSNAFNATGMLAALRETKLAGGKVKFVGFDASQDTVAAMKAGDLQGAVVQDPMQMGYKGVMAIVSHLKGEKVDREIDTGCVLVTPENLDKPNIVDLLNPPLAKYLK